MSESLRKKISLFFLLYITIELLFAVALHAVTVEQQVFSTEEKDPFARTTSPRPQAPLQEMGKTPTMPQMGLVPYKDPRLACLLSLILPGSGEIYLRKDLKGATFCLATAATYTVAFYYYYAAFVQPAALQRQGLLIGSVALLAGAIIHIVSMVESYNDAVQINEARYYFSE
ncbi:MAG: hypothetical protein NZM25_10435 [Leptospiraceae bacterium]|nr:hypothetical protein [Leptospiraceae bacterium]MDW8305844.1 hypothetical protein [Leptospiraceae bacterium]